MVNLLEIRDLFVEYVLRKGALKKPATLHAVNDVSLDIKKGEIRAVAGESGCGKSTLAKALLRLVDSKSGSVKYFSEEGCLDVLNLNKKELKNFRHKAQIIFQNPYSSLNPKMKIYDILREPIDVNKDLPQFQSMTKSDIDNLIVDIVQKVGLEKSSLYLYPHEFSGGQRQRIAIARALVLNPEFVVADEPVSALDVSIQAQIINLLAELKNDLNLTILFISHDLSVIRYLSDRVAIMYLGEIVEIGKSEEVFSDPKHPYTKALLSAAPGMGPTKRIVLEGDLPSPSNLPKGCKFHTRCPHVMEVCKLINPEETVFSVSHCARCHLYRKD